MGHHGASDQIFVRFYQSDILTLDSGNIFRKEEPRPEKADLLAMHSKRDPKAPQFLSPEEKEELLAADEEMQYLLKSRRELRTEEQKLKDKPDHECDRVTIEAAIKSTNLAIARRRFLLFDRGVKEICKAHLYKAETLEISPVPRFDVVRLELAEILYPHGWRPRRPRHSSRESHSTLLWYISGFCEGSAICKSRATIGYGRRIYARR
jgi:hypothetical protein